MSFNANCLFCKIVKVFYFQVQGIIPCHKVLETEYSIAFLDIFPLSKGHLVIPKCKFLLTIDHAQFMHQVPDEYLRDLLPTAKKVSSIIEGDYNILQNNGRLAHQEIDHVHFHIMYSSFNSSPKPNSQKGLGIHWPSEKGDDQELQALKQEIIEKIGK